MDNLKDKQTVSIIIPAYNTGKYIDRCLKSIIEQDYPFFECILVDDGSIDDTFQRCCLWSKMDVRFKVIQQKYSGQSAARNNAMKLATGDYLVFIDSDDYISKNYLSCMVGRALDNNADIVVCNIPQKYNINDLRHIFLQEVLLDNFPGQLWRFLFKKELWQDVVLPQGRYAEDAAVIYKIIDKASNIELIDKQLYFYSINPDGLSNNPNNTYKNIVDRAIMFIDRYSWTCERGYNEEMRKTLLGKAVAFSVGALGRYRQNQYNPIDIEYITAFLREQGIRILFAKTTFSRKIASFVACMMPQYYNFIFNLINS